MAAAKKYSYKDWWDRKISFKNATLVSEGETIKDMPLLVSWDEIKAADKPKIKAKQKEIFNTEVNKTIKKWKTEFTKSYKISKEKRILLTREIDRFEAIMFGPIPTTNNATISFNGVLIPITSLWDIRNYIELTKVNGASPAYDLFHNQSLNTKTHIFPHIYAECCWLYVEWLKMHLKPKKIKKTQQSPVEERNDKKSSGVLVPANPFSDVFKNGYAYNMFLELKKFTVDHKTRVADYSFIFHKMKNPKLNAILIHITQYVFIEFLNKRFDAQIEVKKFAFRDPQKKQATFKTVLDKYEKDILNTVST